MKISKLVFVVMLMFMVAITPVDAPFDAPASAYPPAVYGGSHKLIVSCAVSHIKKNVQLQQPEMIQRETQPWVFDSGFVTITLSGKWMAKVWTRKGKSKFDSMSDSLLNMQIGSHLIRMMNPCQVIRNIKAVALPWKTWDVYVGEWFKGECHACGVHTCEDGLRLFIGARTKRITYVNMKFCRFKRLGLGFLYVH
ncbi:hypothetical protein Tco_0422830 [Tanacetum coccineum]